ncbi:MAG: N-acetyl-gamma-glutamyl-phosphate reductase [Pleurocapsa minor GSE-CHR-MK-17-07R]|jgi:N-acetyl-gamma-glutamyl-phosphate/LysW-gamma-L-alpha-aminoadipyl-6-phosphate reductase|nr:N-acetyl-gamma-glutamyl-phosphate reductase [Pleurocapsa minor GSE-CHR-MK 17-07R]
MIRVGIVGASGYTGGDLLRFLLDHPGVEIAAITSESFAGKFAYQVHPHLRGRTTLKFIGQAALEPVDVLFLALPHGEAQKQIARYAGLAERIIDLSADFRLRDPAVYQQTYGEPHAAPDWLERFVYGLPELNRDALRGAQYASGVGCNATAVTLALYAAHRAQLIPASAPLVADVKVGSSEAGRSPSDSSHHPARAGVVRPFAMTGHRHEAEVRQSLGGVNIRMAVTSVELVRGAAAAVYVDLPGVAEKDLWAAYRSAWGADQPFVRVVHDKTGFHRHPEPRLLAGTNYADVGWELDPENGRAALLCAIDNLGKGAAGSAVQCMNLMCGFDETTALGFGGVYP